MVTLVNFFTGIFAGFAVFGFLGYLAWKLDTTVDGVVDSGIVVLNIIINISVQATT